jgi:hypothetical protein
MSRHLHTSSTSTGGTTTTTTTSTSGGTVLHVGPTQQYQTLGAALAVAQDGTDIQVDAGIYYNDNNIVTHSVTIEGVGGLAHFQSTQAIANGKAIIVDQAATLTIKNLEFSGAQVTDNNGAGIRFEAGNLVVQNSYFHDNQEGILGGAVTNGNVTIDGSQFTHNGVGDGQTHGAYLGTINSLTVTNSNFTDQIGGSDLKSRAVTTLVQHSNFIDSATGTTNYEIDLPNGGNVTIDGSVFNKSATASNSAIVHFGGEISNPVGSLLLENSQLWSERNPTIGVLNQTSLSVSLLDDGLSADVSTSIYGVGSASGDYALSGTAPSPVSLF